jgi:group I intron endonuclease
MLSGIYEIKNTLNNHRYVGSSVNIPKRFGEHRSTLRNNNHHSNYLQKAWNKYGEQHFEFNILEVCEPIKDTLLFLEQKYLDLNPEYNICKNARNTQGVVFTQERKDKIGFATKHRIVTQETRNKVSINSFNSEWNKIQRKPMLMFDLNGNFLIEFNSVCQAALYVGHINHRVDIKRAAQGKRKTAYGYKWKFKET